MDPNRIPPGMRTNHGSDKERQRGGKTHLDESADRGMSARLRSVVATFPIPSAHEVLPSVLNAVAFAGQGCTRPSGVRGPVTDEVGQPRNPEACEAERPGDGRPPCPLVSNQNEQNDDGHEEPPSQPAEGFNAADEIVHLRIVPSS